MARCFGVSLRGGVTSGTSGLGGGRNPRNGFKQMSIAGLQTSQPIPPHSIAPKAKSQNFLDTFCPPPQVPKPRAFFFPEECNAPQLRCPWHCHRGAHLMHTHLLRGAQRPKGVHRRLLLVQPLLLKCPGWLRINIDQQSTKDLGTTGSGDNSPTKGYPPQRRSPCGVLNEWTL